MEMGAGKPAAPPPPHQQYSQTCKLTQPWLHPFSGKHKEDNSSALGWAHLVDAHIKTLQHLEWTAADEGKEQE